jgi:uncharacterized surface protein with fasciclin (FAS1) repeats
MNATNSSDRLKPLAIVVGLTIALGPLAALSFGSKYADEETLDRARAGLADQRPADPLAQYDATRIPGYGMPKTLAEATSGAGIFSEWQRAIETTGTRAMLEGEAPYTVFVPSNAAFAALPREQQEALMADPAALQKVIAGHIVPGRLSITALQRTASAATLAGQPLTVDTQGDLRIDEARIVGSIPTQNGIVHVIDRVLL